MSASPVAAILVSWNSAEELPCALRSLRGQVSESLVVDNGSTDGSAQLARAEQARVLQNGRNLGFGAAVNRGLRDAGSELVLLLNPDAELRSGAVAAMQALFRGRPRLAVVGPRTLNGDGSVQLSFGSDLTPATERRQRRLVRGVARGDPAIAAEVAQLSARGASPDWVSAACWLARREALLSLGGFDEGYFLYEEDADLCRRLRGAGWEIAYTPDAEIVHRKGASASRSGGRAEREYDRSHLRYYRKWNGPLATLVLRLSQRLRGR